MRVGLVDVVLQFALFVFLLQACDSSSPEDSVEPEPIDNTISSIVVTADQRRVVGIGATIQLRAEARNSQGVAIADVVFTWSSENEAVAIVNTSGQVNTTGIGKARIEAESNGISGSIEIDALPSGPRQLFLATPFTVLPDGGFIVDLSLTALDALEDPISDPDVLWSSSDPEVVSVDDTGQIITGSQGSAVIFVSSGDAEAQLPLDVVAVSGDGILEVDLSLLSTFKQIESDEIDIGAPGMSAAIVVEGRLVLARGYGIAGTGNDVNGLMIDRVEPNSVFRIADVSKPITAVSVLKLVEQERLSLDDSLLSVVPDIVPLSGLTDERAREIKIWSLLEHKGGWDRAIGPNPLYELQMISQDLGVSLPPSSQDVGRWVFGQELDFNPGSRFSFNDINYFMLGQVIEAASGQSYASFVQNEILAPIGISTMQIGGTLQQDRIDGEVEYFHGGVGPSVFDDFPGELPNPYGGSFDMALLGASGGWIGSVIDLARFGLAIHRRSVISDDLLHDYMISDNSGNGVYGAGWILDGRNFLHTGAIDGSRSLLYVYEDGTVLALLLNGNSNINFRRWLDPIIAQDEWPMVDLFGKY